MRRVLLASLAAVVVGSCSGGDAASTSESSQAPPVSSTTTMEVAATVTTTQPTSTTTSQPLTPGMPMVVATTGKWGFDAVVAGLTADGLPMMAALRDLGDGVASWGLWICSDRRCSTVEGPVEMGSPTGMAANPYLVELWNASPVLGSGIEQVEFFACESRDCSKVDQRLLEFPGSWGLARGPSGEGVFWSYQEAFTLHLESWTAGIGEVLGGAFDYETEGGRFVNVLPSGEVLYFDSQFGETIQLGICSDARCDAGPDLVTFDLEPPEEGMDLLVVFSLLAGDESPTFIVTSQNDTSVWHQFIDCADPTCTTWEAGPWIALSDWIEGDPAWVDAILQDDLPVLMFTEYTTNADSESTELVVVACETSTCEQAAVTHTGESTTFGHDAVAGAEGPIIVYFPGDVPSELRVLACSSPSCAN